MYSPAIHIAFMILCKDSLITVHVHIVVIEGYIYGIPSKSTKTTSTIVHIS